MDAFNRDEITRDQLCKLIDETPEEQRIMYMRTRDRLMSHLSEGGFGWPDMSKWQRQVTSLAAEMMHVRKSDEAVPPAGALRDGPPEPDPESGC